MLSVKRDRPRKDTRHENYVCVYDSLLNYTCIHEGWEVEANLTIFITVYL